MQDLKMIEDRGVLRWGGLAGTLGGIVMIVVFVIVAVFVGADALEPAGNLERFPEIRAARTVENGLYLVALVLWMVHFLALYRALRATNLAAALFGSALAAPFYYRLLVTGDPIQPEFARAVVDAVLAVHAAD